MMTLYTNASTKTYVGALSANARSNLYKNEKNLTYPNLHLTWFDFICVSHQSFSVFICIRKSGNYCNHEDLMMNIV